jgi:hypothetical protein
MLQNFSDETKRVIESAGQIARELNHTYIGTEHLLLALLDQRDALSAIRALGADESRIRAEIAALVPCGTEAAAATNLALTPRANRAMGYADSICRALESRRLETGHLLLGLIHEPDGVAGVVMRKAGLTYDQVRGEVFKIRLAQMRIVERAVRPVRADGRTRRKMRDELLAHLIAIYEEERARLSEPAAAMREAAKRFGSPDELSRELDRSQPIGGRIGYSIARRFGWRAPESAVAYLRRVAIHSFIGMGIFAAVALGIIGLLGRFDWIGCRVLLGMVLLLPVDQFLIGLLYFKMRDALHGAFGQPKSLSRVGGYALLSALIIPITAPLFVLMTQLNLGGILTNIPLLAGLALWTVLATLLQAKWHGRAEIVDTVWECLDLNGADQFGSPAGT